jgi:protein-S-isoprenylcysteine O-methyltransferase Ste14
MIDRLPPLIAGSCLLVYWATVAAKAVRFARKEAHDANVIPRERTGRMLRLIWGPLIVAWCVQPWLQVSSDDPTAARQLGGFAVAAAFIGAAVCIVATVATFSCWREMGKSWRIGIDPREKTQLVFTGAYRFVRHPIYALSILLITGTLATTPTSTMLCIALLHIVLLQIEARREEAYLLEKHGATYGEYRKRVGRFVPRGFGS